jgi:predicted MFS family arabinose efflux permease
MREERTSGLGRPVCQLLLLVLAVAAASCLGSLLSPVQESLRISLRLSDNQMALLQGFAVSLPAMATSIPVGLAIDRYSRVRLLLAFLAMLVFCNLWIAFAGGFVGLLLTRVATGPFVHGNIMAAESLIGDIYPPTQRGRASMLLSVGQIAGTAAAFALGGALLGRFATTPNGWRWAMVGATALVAPVLLLLPGMREPPRKEVVLKNASPSQSFSQLWSYRGRVGTLLVGFVMGEVAINCVSVWAAPTLSRNLALTPAKVGEIVSVMLLAGGILGSIGGGAIADFCQRIGRARRTMWVIVCLSAISAPAGMFGLASSVALASMLLGAYIMVRCGILVMTLALFTIVVPNEIRGLSLAVSGAANVFIGSGLAPLTVSFLSGLLGGTHMIGVAVAVVSGSASMVCAAAFLLGIRFVPETT